MQLASALERVQNKASDLKRNTHQMQDWTASFKGRGSVRQLVLLGVYILKISDLFHRGVEKWFIA